VGICILVAAATAVSALELRHFEGTWVGDRNGSEMVWRFDTDGLMRLDGRRAHWSTRADSILVEFDPPDGDGSSSEKAVYRFIASDPTVGYRRLFVYGFDLGQVGVLLTRRVSDEDMARLQSTMKAGPTAGNAAKAPEPMPVSRSASGESSPQR
jgi:hypothetical protein